MNVALIIEIVICVLLNFTKKLVYRGFKSMLWTHMVLGF